MALQDFDIFSVKEDPNGKLTIASDNIVAANITGLDAARVADDKGVGFVDKDFTHEFEVQITADASIGAQCGCWSLSDVIADYRNGTSIGDWYITTSVGFPTNSLIIGVQKNFSNAQKLVTLPTGGKNNNFYCRVTYVKSTDRLTLYVYSDSGRRILVGSQFQDNVFAFSQAALKYVYGLRTQGSIASSSSIIVRNLNLVRNDITVGDVTAEPGDNHDIYVTVPYINDDNNNSTYTVDYKLSSDSEWINHITDASNTPSPFLTTIENLRGDNNYDVRITYNDSDGVEGTNPQISSNIYVPRIGKIIDHNQAAKNRLLEQYKGKTGIEGLIESYYGTQIQDLEDVLFLFFDRLNIELSEGVQLDGIGKIINQDRLGLTDELYRLFIRARIGANVSESDIERIIDVWQLITQANLIKLEQIYPAEINLASDVALPPELVDLAYALIQNVSAAGVGVGVTTFLPSDAFAFDGADPLITKGFGNVISQGTTTGTTAFKLIDSGATFQTDGVDDTMVAMNDTDGTKANIISVDGEDELTLDADIFTTGEDYYINANTGGQLAQIQGGA